MSGPYHFCNVFRELDRGTQLYLKKVVPPARGIEDLVWRTITYRLVNSAEQFAATGWLLGMDSWPEMIATMRRLKLKLWTPAYIILAQPKTLNNRLDRLVEPHPDAAVLVDEQSLERRLELGNHRPPPRPTVVDLARLMVVFDVFEQRPPHLAQTLLQQLRRDHAALAEGPQDAVQSIT